MSEYFKHLPIFVSWSVRHYATGNTKPEVAGNYRGC